MTAPAIFSRRLRRCFFERAALPFGLAPPRVPDPPDPRAGAGRPLRAAVVRARPPAGGRPEPPPPVGRERDGDGRRTEPARGATGEVSSWAGTREPLSGLSWSAIRRAGSQRCRGACRLELWKRGRRGRTGASA